MGSLFHKGIPFFYRSTWNNQSILNWPQELHFKMWIYYKTPNCPRSHWQYSLCFVKDPNKTIPLPLDWKGQVNKITGFKNQTSYFKVLLIILIGLISCLNPADTYRSVKYRSFQACLRWTLTIWLFQDNVQWAHICVWKMFWDLWWRDQYSVVCSMFAVFVTLSILLYCDRHTILLCQYKCKTFHSHNLFILVSSVTN